MGLTVQKIARMLNERIILKRTYSEKQTVGVFEMNGDIYNTVELPWKDNQKQKSCIPEGVYICTRRFSEKYGLHYHVQGVVDRSYILIHPANYTKQLLGCLAPGDRLVDMDKDGLMDVVNSRVTLNKMLEFLGESFILEIKKA